MYSHALYFLLENLWCSPPSTSFYPTPAPCPRKLPAARGQQLVPHPALPHKALVLVAQGRHERRIVWQGSGARGVQGAQLPCSMPSHDAIP